MNASELFTLSNHGPDTFVGVGPRYHWGGLYGGQIVAQALRAAEETVEPELEAHSLRAYFIRRGDHSEPIRYEVDRIRNGRSFCTRRVVARQAIGAILNLEASFQRAEPSVDIETVKMPSDLPSPDDGPDDSWSSLFRRVWVHADHLSLDRLTGAGRAAAWFRATDDLGDQPVLQRCMLAYLSDDLPTDAVVRATPGADGSGGDDREFFSASLDHTMWFHRPVRADAWHLHDFTCHSFVAGRGLAIGHVFADDGQHVATVAQEVLRRSSRRATVGP